MEETRMIESLKKLGITVSVEHYTGDSSFSTEYVFKYGSIRVVEPTLDMALIAFISKLLGK